MRRGDCAYDILGSADALGGQRKALELLTLQLQVTVSFPTWVLGLLGPFQEQHMLLSAESFPQCPYLYLKRQADSQSCITDGLHIFYHPHWVL